MPRSLSFLFAVALLTVGSQSTSSVAFAQDPRDVAFGSFEMTDPAVRRVDSLLEQSFETAYPRYDAPEGMTFLVFRCSLTPTFQKASPNDMASIPSKEVFVETQAGRSSSIGRVDATGTSSQGPASLLAVKHENFVDVYPFSAVFLIPRTAKRATVHAAATKFEAPLEGEILPRLDWRDGMDVEVQRIVELAQATSPVPNYDSFAELSYAIERKLEPRAKSLLAATLRIVPKFPSGIQREGAFSVIATDFRLAREGKPPLLPIAERFDESVMLMRQPAKFSNLTEEGTLEPIEMTLVFPLYEPVGKAKLTFRGDPLGEFDVERAPPAPAE